MNRARALIDAANAIAGDPALRAALVTGTGLSAEGVALALDEHLELTPSADEWARLAEARLPKVDSCTVVLSANVFTAALRALVVAALHADRVLVRTSRREPVFAPRLVQTARMQGARWLELDASREPPHTNAVHVYGRTETVETIRARLAPETHLYAHGPGFAAAFATSPEHAAAIARDIVPFDQRGCLSPRLTLFAGDVAEFNAFCTELSEQLRTWERRVPRGLLEEGAEWARYRATWQMSDALVLEGPTHLVVGTTRELCALAPSGRAMHVVAVRSWAHARALLTPFAPHLTAIAGAPEAPFPRVRAAKLGELQRPPLDGPVDLRVI